MVPEAQHAIALADEKGIPRGIGGFGWGTTMGFAVQLDHQSCLGGEKIDDIVAEPDLAAELASAKLSVA
ncbi:MAG: hypothetical protein A4S16_13930 [Proteobacteria bacterium SG_bin6]|nr:MAG: hypothetical protein A4S16_13930 [Proteobacteria bacterium SG_bin6]